MPVTATVSRSASLMDHSVADTRQVSGDAFDGFVLTAPAALAGTLTTRTDNDTGVVTLGSGHGLTTSDLVDVYWANGGKRRGLTITATDSTTITVDAGVGDNLPTADTAVTAGKVVAQEVLLTGNNVLFVLADAGGAVPATVCFRTSGGEALHVALTATTPAYIWDGVGTNPLAGAAVTAVRVSQGAVGGPATIRGTVLLS